MKLGSLCLALLLVLPPLRQASADCYQFSMKWGSTGPGGGPFDVNTRSLAWSPDHRVVLLGGNALQIFDESGASISTVPFSSVPAISRDLTVDASGNIYVSQGDAFPILKIDPAGTIIGRYGAGLAPEDEIYLAYHLAVAPGGTVFIQDANRRRILRFGSGGGFLGKFGGPGSGAGQFRGMGPMVIGTDGYLYVVDQELTATPNPRVQVFDIDGTYRREFVPPPCGSGPGESVRGMSIDRSGYLFLARSLTSPAAACLQKIDSQGSVLCTWSSYGTADGQVQSPFGGGVDDAGNVYVYDSTARQVLKFAVGPEPVIPATWSGVKTLYR